MIILTFAILLIIYIIYLYKNSNSDYFYKQRHYNTWDRVIKYVIYNYEFSEKRIDYFKKAYLYFVANPSHFDGATIVKDITQVKGLDIPAMAHDFAYIHSKVIKDRLKADWNYAQDYRKFEVPFTIAYSRMILLMFINITGIYFLKNLIKK